MVGCRVMAGQRSPHLLQPDRTPCHRRLPQVNGGGERGRPLVRLDPQTEADANHLSYRIIRDAPRLVAAGQTVPGAVVTASSISLNALRRSPPARDRSACLECNARRFLMRFPVFLAALSLLACSGAADAQGGRWHSLASTTVSLGIDRSTIRTQARGRYRQVRLCVSRRPVQVNSLVVGLANGRSQSIPVRRVIRAGECTRASTIGPRPLSIRSVSFSFLRLRSGTRPLVRLEAR